MMNLNSITRLLCLALCMMLGSSFLGQRAARSPKSAFLNIKCLPSETSGKLHSPQIVSRDRLKRSVMRLGLITATAAGAPRKASAAVSVKQASGVAVEAQQASGLTVEEQLAILENEKFTGGTYQTLYLCLHVCVSLCLFD